jgi:hypothetical protein
VSQWGSPPPGAPPPPAAPPAPPPAGPFGGYGVGMPAGVNPDVVNEGYVTGGGGGPGGSRDNLAMLSLVFGVTSVLLAFCCGPMGVLLGVVGVVFGIVALSRGAQGGQKSQAIIGIVLGAIGPILYVGMWVFMFGFLKP